MTVDWFKVINSTGNTTYSNQLSNASSAVSYGINGQANDWSFIQIGTGGLTITDSLEDAPALPPVDGVSRTKLAKLDGNLEQSVQTIPMDLHLSRVQV